MLLDSNIIIYLASSTHWNRVTIPRGDLSRQAGSHGFRRQQGRGAGVSQTDRPRSPKAGRFPGVQVMRLLLDTSAFLRFIAGSDGLGEVSND
uniref:Uncharacterized protein n=1 Tax=Candidatus Kentrum sp. TC TaxID=2126339 RepID=A0A450YX78_9GAMM|nr:MAG: hypothetical protein BECKTC1821D_GA0114238_102823 [Candidatus Kentron sp. TC]